MDKRKSLLSEPNEPLNKEVLRLEITKHQDMLEDVKKRINCYKENLIEQLVPQNDDQARMDLIKKVIACGKLLEPYQQLFDIDVIKEDEMCKFKLCFKDAKAYPIHFLINMEMNDITDFWVSSICSQKQEKILKNRYKTDKNMATVINTLRAILVKKNIVQ